MSTLSQTTRYGFYYYPDTTHYRDSDAHAWIPELQLLGAGWLTLLASVSHAIPEAFIEQLIAAGIQPIIHLPLPINAPGALVDVSLFFEAYARWGVRYIALFDRPNQMQNWDASSWTQKNLVERFLDKYIPMAEAARASGLLPAFPPLEPGGDYWDTAFLFTALQGLQRRGHDDLLDHLVLSAYAWPGNRSPDWGAGGPERWPAAKPYATPQNSEDQLGFRIFDWYLATAQAAIGKTMPVICLAAGSRIGDQPDQMSPAVDAEAHAWQNMTIVKLMQGQNQEYEPVPSEVLACNFWVLSASPDDPQVTNAWYKPDQQQLPVVSMLKDWVANGGGNRSVSAKNKPLASNNYYNPRPIAHYLLLPSFEWGKADWRLDAIQPFINKYQPTIGFSPVEASHARKVTVFAGTGSVPEAIIDGLLTAGCVVEQINGDGMNIASNLTSRPSE
jgi:hypothetical protein